jgi:Holliday junction resolvasome RuvABC DNA-binding subunit
MITIKSTNNVIFTIDINDCLTILDIKNKINQFDVKDMILIFNGFILQDEQNIKYYNINNDSYMILYIRKEQKNNESVIEQKLVDNTNVINNSISTALQSVGYTQNDIKNSMANSNNNFLSILSELEKNDNKNIDTLVSLGFSKNTAKQAYFACDRNLDNAANFLFSSMY